MRNDKARPGPLAVFVLSCALACGTAHAAPLSFNDPYQWLENRSTNTLGRIPGLRQNVGVTSVTPNGLAGTTATATQGTTVRVLPYSGSSAFPNEFNFTIPADPALYGAWRLDFVNGANTLSLNTPAIGSGLLPMPFASDVKITNANATSFAWKIPPAASVDAVRINLFDHGQLNLAGTGADIVFNATYAPTTTTFTLPATLVNGQPLLSGHLYTLEINLLDYASNLPNGSQNDLRNRSRLYVDFLPGPTPAVGAYLPVVEPGVGGANPIFHFNVTSVGSELIYIDPEVATGYVYRKGVGNPNFASVLLPPAIGDGNYQVVLEDGQTFDVTGGTAFSFAAGGVSSFAVLGIEPEAGLNPSDPTAFMTGLTFAANGTFTGTMQAVPELPSAALALLGLAALGAHRLRASSPATARPR